jgi:hypothetical protein
MENIGFIIKVILTVIDLALPNHCLNAAANEEKKAFMIKVMDECHQIIRLNNNILPNKISDNLNINTKEGN